jgi:propanol-preferring alcohol dehydrogenase
MPKTVNAGIVLAFGEPLAAGEAPVPEAGPGSIQVAIQASGDCHTDCHAASGDWPVEPSPPFIPGHEGVGFVSAVGAGVKHIKEGDRVGVPWLHSACGLCIHCLGGWETLCERRVKTGYFVNLGFAEYVIANVRKATTGARRASVQLPAPPSQMAPEKTCLSFRAEMV